MPRNKRKHPHTRYERIMLACINSLPFKFNSPGQPNIPETQEYRPTKSEHTQRQLSDRSIKGEAREIRVGKEKGVVFTGQQYAPYIKKTATPPHQRKRSAMN